MPKYAQLDAQDKVHTVCNLSGDVDAPNMIPIESVDETLIGKTYNRDTGEFEDAPEPE